MTRTETPDGRMSPYLLAEPPTSPGRVLLSWAFSHWCALHYGHSPEDLASAFDIAGTKDAVVSREVRIATRVLGELIASGAIRTYARPFGGGSPRPVPASDWELDDFRDRMSTSAMDPTRPFDALADPTHWIFVDLENFNVVTAESCGETSRPFQVASRPVAGGDTTVVADVAPQGNQFPDDRHVRLPEVMRRTGMSRSTIYRRMEQNRFPSQLPLDGNIAAWRESEVAAWLAKPN